jgi:hypothetical protein
LIKKLLATALFLGGPWALQASSVLVGQVKITTDGLGSYQITVDNLTGPGSCSAIYEVCDSVSFVNWVLTVHYNDGTSFLTDSDTYAVHGAIAPGVDLAPGAGSPPWTVPLCSNAFLDCPGTDPLWTITGLDFIGEVDTSPLLDFFSGPTTFIPGSFSANFTPAAPIDPAFYYDATDITLTDVPPPPAGVPEPATLALLGAGIGMLAIRKRRAAKI